MAIEICHETEEAGKKGNIGTRFMEPKVPSLWERNQQLCMYRAHFHAALSRDYLPGTGRCFYGFIGRTGKKRKKERKEERKEKRKRERERERKRERMVSCNAKVILFFFNDNTRRGCPCLSLSQFTHSFLLIEKHAVMNRQQFMIPASICCCR